MDSLLDILAFQFGSVSEVHTRYAFMLPSLAEGIFVVKQRQFFYDVVHNQKSVDLRFVGHVLLVGLTQLTHLVDVETLVRVYFQHASHQTAQFLAVALRRRGKVPFRDTLEKLVQVQIFFI